MNGRKRKVPVPPAKRTTAKAARRQLLSLWKVGDRLGGVLAAALAANIDKESLP